MEQLRVLVCRVGVQPRVEMVKNDYYSLKTLVGGYLESISLEPGIDLWCNEEALLLELPLNRVFPARAARLPKNLNVVYLSSNLALPGELGEHRIHGDFFIASHDRWGETESLSLSAIAKYSELFKLPL